MIRARWAAKAGLLLFAFCVVGCAAPSRVSTTAEAVLDVRVPELLRKYRVSSVSLAQVEEGRVVLERAYGAQSAGVAANPQTLYNLASLTKPIVAEVLLRLVADGELSLDEPMWKYWIDPDIAADPRVHRLTLRHALSHQSGLPNWRGHRPDGKLAFLFGPGDGFGYSGEGYHYAAKFAQQKTGRNFEVLAQQELFAPLGMTSTSFSFRDWMNSRLAAPLDGDHWGHPQVESQGQWNAANNLITTAGDYARFIASVMRGDAMIGSLRAERFEPARGPQPRWVCQAASADTCPRDSRIVFGWNRLDFNDGPVFMHTGSNGRAGGERTLAYFDPKRRRGIVVLTSGSEGERLYRDIAGLIDPAGSAGRYLASQ